MSRKGTYFEIDRLTNRVLKLEQKVKAFEVFMNNWGPDVQKKRDERDARWDEMIRVLTVQERKSKKSEKNKKKSFTFTRKRLKLQHNK